jgi:N-methylhydantoinase A
MADILGLKRYLIPRFVAGLSAFGGLISDLRWEENGTLHTSSRQFDTQRVNELLRRLRANGNDFMKSAGVPESMRRFEYAFFGRYEYQSWEIEVRFDPRAAGLTDSDLGMLVGAFHEMHDRIYSIRSDHDVVEFTTWKVRAIGTRNGSDLWRGHVLPSSDAPARPKGNRSVYMRDDGGMRPIPVYDAHAASFRRCHCRSVPNRCEYLHGPSRARSRRHNGSTRQFAGRGTVTAWQATRRFD